MTALFESIDPPFLAYSVLAISLMYVKKTKQNGTKSKFTDNAIFNGKHMLQSLMKLSIKMIIMKIVYHAYVTICNNLAEYMGYSMDMIEWVPSAAIAPTLVILILKSKRKENSVRKKEISAKIDEVK